jgi:hypothetical protein
MSLLTATLVAAAIGGQNPLDVKVSVTNYGARATVVVSELAKASGLDLKADSVMDRDIVAIYTKDQPMKDVMDRMADTIQGRWAKSGATYTLKPDKNARDRLEQAELAKHNQLLGEAVEATRKQHNSLAKEQQSDVLVDRLALELFAANGDADIVRLEGGERIVYSSSPTSMQKRLKGSPVKLILEMIKAHNVRAAQQQSGVDDDLPDEFMSGPMKEFFEKYKPKPLKRIEGQPAKLNMVVSSRVVAFLSGRERMLPGARFMLFDTNGNVLTSHEVWLQNSRRSSFARRFEHAASEGEVEQEKEQATHPIEMSRESMLFLSSQFGQGNLSDEDKAYLDVLRSHPYENEPLKYGFGEALAKAAEALGKNGVFYLADDQLYDGGDATAEATLEALSDNSVLLDENGWITSRPMSQTTARKVRIDRRTLQTALQQRQKQGYLTLDQKADFAAKNPLADQGMFLFSIGYQSMEMSAPELGGSDWKTLRFYGALNGLQRQTLKQGGQISMATLGGGAKAVLNEMVFGTETNLQVGQGSAKERRKFDFMEMMTGGMADAMSGAVPDAFKEPTEVFGNGLPTNGFIDSGAFNEPVFLPTSGDEELMRIGSVGVEILALFQMITEATKGTEFGGEMPMMGKVKLGKRTAMQLVFQLAPEVYLTRNLNDDSFAGAQEYAPSQLPEDVLAQISEQQKALAPMKMLFQMMGGMDMGGGRVDPPLN